MVGQGRSVSSVVGSLVGSLVKCAWWLTGYRLSWQMMMAHGTPHKLKTCILEPGLDQP